MALHAKTGVTNNKKQPKKEGNIYFEALTWNKDELIMGDQNAPVSVRNLDLPQQSVTKKSQKPKQQSFMVSETDIQSPGHVGKQETSMIGDA